MPHIQPQRHTPLLKGSLKNLFFPPERNEYSYFSDTAAFPFATSRDVVKAAWAADASMLCYSRYGVQRMTDQEFEQNLAAGRLTLVKKVGEDPIDWNAPGTQAFFATGNGFAILAFRGTEADDPQNLHDDLDILLVPEPDYRSGAAPHLGFFSSVAHLFSDPCLVHRGFQVALNRVWDQVYKLLAQYRRDNPNDEICLTGHSLGGALALLTYSRFRDDHVSAYTFGCPRVGNTAFRERVSAAGQGHYRCVNFNDLVTHIPLESALYLHVPQNCYRFDEAGWLDEEHGGTLGADLAVLERVVGGLPADFMKDPEKLDELAAPPGLVDHSPARYCMRLWDCV